MKTLKVIIITVLTLVLQVSATTTKTTSEIYVSILSQRQEFVGGYTLSNKMDVTHFNTIDDMSTLLENYKKVSKIYKKLAKKNTDDTTLARLLTNCSKHVDSRILLLAELKHFGTTGEGDGDTLATEWYKNIKKNHIGKLEVIIANRYVQYYNANEALKKELQRKEIQAKVKTTL